ncbi:MAG: hypothetical protein QOH64_59 [Acidimicrobiaceae bacterium]
MAIASGVDLALLQTVVDEVSEVIVVLDDAGRVVFVNRAAERLLGDPIEAWMGREVLDHIHPDDLAVVATRLAANHAGSRRSSPLPVRVRRANGSYVWLEAVATNRVDDAGVGGMIVSLRDITERREHARELAEAELRFRLAFEAAPIGMALVAPDGSFQRVNRSLCELVGLPAEVLSAMTFQEITHPDDLDADLDYVNQMLDGSIEAYSMEKRYFHASGSMVWILLSVSLVRSESGEPLHFISQMQDITARKEMEQKLIELSNHDALTGLPNRRLLDKELADRLRSDDGAFAVLFLDLDNLKTVNDTAGHDAGDRVLIESAMRLSSAVQSGDLVARCGGDEFVVIASNVRDASEADVVAERLRAAVERPIAHGHHSLMPRVSIGATVARAGEVSPSDLLARADASMYDVKRTRSSG